MESETHIQAVQTGAIRRVTAKRLAMRERQRQALELRLSGLTFQSIAGELRCSKHTAHRLVTAALDATIKEPAERVREMELHRLDGLFAGFWPKAQKGDPVAAAACLKVMEHRARLLGLFASEPEPVSRDVIQVVLDAEPKSPCGSSPKPNSHQQNRDFSREQANGITDLHDNITDLHDNETQKDHSAPVTPGTT
jgi:hypothetical protein